MPQTGSTTAADMLALESRRLGACGVGKLLTLVAIAAPFLIATLLLSVYAATTSPGGPIPNPLYLVLPVLLGVLVPGAFAMAAVRRERALNRELHTTFPASRIRELPCEELSVGQCIGSHRVVISTPDRLTVRHRAGASAAIPLSAAAALLAAGRLIAAGVCLRLSAGQPPVDLDPRISGGLLCGALLLGLYAARPVPVGWTLTRDGLVLLTVRAGVLLRRTRTPIAEFGEARVTTDRLGVPQVVLRSPAGSRPVLTLHPPSPRYGLRTAEDQARHRELNAWVADAMTRTVERMRATPTRTS